MGVFQRIGRRGVVSLVTAALVSAWVVPEAEARRRKRKRAGEQTAASAGGREPNALARQWAARGQTALRHAKLSAALGSYTKAYAADPLPRFHRDLGDIYEKLGNLAQAHWHYERWLAELPDAPDYREVEALALMLRLKLARTHGRLVVESDVPAARVEVAGAEPLEGDAPLSHWIPVGEATVTVWAEGHEVWESKVTMRPGLTEHVRARFRRRQSQVAAGGEPREPTASEAAADAGADADAPFEPMEMPSLMREVGGRTTGPPWPALASLGAGGALLAGGGLFGLLSRAAERERDDLAGASWQRNIRWSEAREQEEKAISRALAANVLLGVGAASALTGLVLLALEHDSAPDVEEEDEGEEVPSLVLVPGPTPFGAAVSGRLP